MGSDGGTGEVGPRPGGLMQDPVLLQRMAVQQKEKRQQTVLGGCGGEAAGIFCHDGSRNGGAAARAAASGRLPVVMAASRQRSARAGFQELADRSESGEDSGAESEGGDPDGGAAVECGYNC